MNKDKGGVFSPFFSAGHPGEEDIGNFLLQALGQKRYEHIFHYIHSSP